MIISFKDQATEDLFHGITSKKSLSIPHDIWSVAQRKLDVLNSAHDLKDLLVSSGNRLETLKGDLKGYHSVRINDQYRVVFKWVEGSAGDVEIVDYH